MDAPVFAIFYVITAFQEAQLISLGLSFYDEVD